MEPNATKAALAGAADHCARLSCCGEAGITGGAMLFDTMSKMPALLRSLYSVVSNVVFNGPTSGVPGLKSAAARRIRAAPRLVPVLTQSCAWAGSPNARNIAIRSDSRGKAEGVGFIRLGT